MNVRIRPAAKGDLDALGAVERSAAALFRSVGLDWIAEAPPTALAVLDLCRAAGTLWVAAEDGAGPVGFLAATDLDGAFFVLELSVAAEHQRRGLGRTLLAAALDHARWRFYGAAALTTYRDLPWNGPFYAAQGFATLRAADLPPGLKARLAQEARQGRPDGSRWPRCCERSSPSPARPGGAGRLPSPVRSRYIPGSVEKPE